MARLAALKITHNSEDHEQRAPTRRFARRPGRAWPSMPPPRIGHSAQGIWVLGSLIEGLAHGH
jgi:hypothetical protein